MINPSQPFQFTRTPGPFQAQTPGRSFEAGSGRLTDTSGLSNEALQIGPGTDMSSFLQSLAEAFDTGSDPRQQKIQELQREISMTEQKLNSVDARLQSAQGWS